MEYGFTPAGHNYTVILSEDALIDLLWQTVSREVDHET